jgi:hypothetical protein
MERLEAKEMVMEQVLLETEAEAAGRLQLVEMQEEIQELAVQAFLR